jgi:hypothetical protein
LDPKTLTGEQTLDQAKAAAKEHTLRHALMAPHDLAWYYRPKRAKYRRRTDVPATKPKKGNRRGRIRKDPFA